MKKAIVFGATTSARTLYEQIEREYEIVAFCDNDKHKWGNELGGVSIIAPIDIETLEWDEIIITSLSSMEIIRKQLLEIGIPGHKINTAFVDKKVKARKSFLHDFASIVYENKISGCVAEAGVFQGEFASEINICFPDRRLYLFDTFEGFDERDIVWEAKNMFSDAAAGHLNLTSEMQVLNKMRYPENCIIKKGYFPESAEGITHSFCYVNLDMDLYKPTLEGLRLFYPLMENGGIITIHDYFLGGYKGVKAAVSEFMSEMPDKIIPFPIGDNVSVAIQKR